MKINGIIWFLVGVFMFGFSFFIAGKGSDMQKLTLFIWTGVVFMIIGIIKTVLWVNAMSKKPKLAKENFQHHQPTHQQPTQQHQHHQQPTQFVKFCSNCNTALRHFDKFCMKCGSRMFRK